MRRLLIDRDRIGENIRTVLSAAGGAAVYAVLKADGYGLGLEPLARVLGERGVTRFAVTEPGDARTILRMGIPAEEILLLRPLPREEIGPLLAAGKVTFSVGAPEEAVALAREGLRLGRRPRVHVQVDTGLGRYGFRWDDPAGLRFLYKSFTALEFGGIYTHFAGRERMIRRQFDRFMQVMEALRGAGIDPGLRHCCSSAVLFHHPEMRLDGVRVGSALLGRIPGGEEAGLRDVCRCEAAVTAVRTLLPGDTVGYGARFRARREMRVAVVELGSVHGLGARAACGWQSPAAFGAELARQIRDFLRGGALSAELDGRTVPVVGKPCSECAVLDVTGLNVAPGDRAVFFLNPLYCGGVARVWRGEKCAAKPAVLPGSVAPVA